MIDAVDELEMMANRIEWLIKAAEGKTQIGHDDTAELDELEALTEAYMAKAKSLAGPSGKLVAFRPKVGRF